MEPYLSWTAWGSQTFSVSEVNAMTSMLLNASQISFGRTGKIPDSPKKQLKNGLSYPSARMQALSEYTGDAGCTAILSEPNNILGIEYLKAIKKLNSRILPYTIKRAGAHYHDRRLSMNT